MKNKILYILILASLSIQAQNLSPLNDFVGIWENDNGTETFQVELFIALNSFSQENYIRGHYKLTDNATGNIIYKSNKTFVNSLGETITIWPLIGVWYDGVDNLVGGTVLDNSTSNYVNTDQGGLLRCNLSLTLQNTCSGCTPQLVWEVSRMMGTIVGPMFEPNIPTDLILTKVE